jgi:hypothetical protein
MAKQTLVFVALPDGIAPNGRLRLSLYFTPRLEAGATLAAFPDLLDWPDLIRRKGITFRIASGSRTANVPARRQVLRPDLWREIFTPHTHVASFHNPDFERRLIVSYPVRDALAYVKFAYQFAATQLSGKEQRLFGTLLGDLVFRDGRDSTLDADLAQLRVAMWREQQRVASVPQFATRATRQGAVDGVDTSLSRPAGTRAMAERFALYHRLPPAKNRPPLPSTAADFAKVMDFHKALTAICSYPALMRALGLVFDLELPASLCAASPASPGGAYSTLALGAVDAGFKWALAPEFVFPATAYFRDSRSFNAAPATTASQLAARQYLAADVIDGLLALAPNFFQLAGVDMDGAMLKAMGLADNFANVRDKSSVEQLLPSLRSGGISLIANGRAQQLLSAIRDNKAFDNALRADAPMPRPFNARDLVRGYRLDIWSSRTRRWHSLHRRNSRYRFGADGGVEMRVDDEEGFAQLAVTQAADDPTRPADPVSSANGMPQPDSDLYVHERVARWNGWSLSAPRPGQALNRSPDPGRATMPDPTEGEPLTPFKMTTAFTAAAGSLPSLRFGARYRLRARAVDLAGNSQPLSMPAPSFLIVPSGARMFPHLRFEPVPHPVLVLRREPGAGASLAQMAIRSRNSNPALDRVASAETDERHVAPPQASVLMVEQHGMLDDAHGRLRGDAATYGMIVARDKGQIPKVGNTPMDPSAQLKVPYFSDPIARGAALAQLPNTSDNTNGAIRRGELVYTPLKDVQPRPGSVTHIDFGGTWPERRAFRVVMQEGKAPPHWDSVARVLTVSLPKAEEITINVSSYVRPADLHLMGVWNWMREFFEAADSASMQGGSANTEVTYATDAKALLTRQVLDGGHEMITPSIALTLVHAVQQPLGRPQWTLLPVTHQPGTPAVPTALSNAFSPITAWRSLGSHHAVLLGGLHIHGKSSARIDIEARWTEVIDDPAAPAPSSTPASDHVETISLTSLTGGILPADGSAQRYVAVYVPAVDTLWFAAPFDSLQGVSSPWSMAAPVHQFGDTKHRRVWYTAVAASRFKEYFDEANLDYARTSDRLTVDVPSSARPLTPEIAYVMPTFGWERQETTNVKTEIRFGNGIRVYINRPWYSSGEGELLGVALWPQSRSAPSDEDREKYKSVFTQWGLDPIWKTGDVGATPSLADFPNAVATGSALSIEESDLAVDVAGHAVGFDTARRLWYCDITFQNPQAYAPFVRLALGRFQPRSIAGVELSHLVLTDIAQLTPDRSAALSVDPADPRRGRLYVGGLAPEGPTRSFITISVEKRAARIESDLGWRAAPINEVSVMEDSPAPASANTVLWSGSVTFANPPPPGNYRIVVREFEVLEADPVPGAISDAPNYAERLIYAAIIAYDFDNAAS